MYTLNEVSGLNCSYEDQLIDKLDLNAFEYLVPGDSKRGRLPCGWQSGNWVISKDYRVMVGLELCAVTGSELGESWPKE